MIKEIKYHLYDDNNAMESSLLRGILLFNCLEKRRSRKDFIPRAVFSIIVEGDGEYSNTQILSLFNSRFKYGMTLGELSTIIQNLKKDGHLDAQGTVILKNNNGKEFFEAIDLETSNLFDRIIRKTELLLKSSFSNPGIVKENIRRALSVYFKLYGYAFFDLQENSWDESAGEAISRAMENISEREGCALVKVLGETLNGDDETDQMIIKQWARAFIIMEVINLDPSLRDFKAEKLRGKEFILDTDFVLRCLTSSLEQSQPYKTIINQLKSLGCKMYLPKEVMSEVKGHISEALSTYYKIGDGIKTYPPEVFRSGYGNVFLEDYTTLLGGDETKKDMSFLEYIHNVSDCRKGDHLLKTVLSGLFGEETLERALNVQVEKANQDKLQEKILEYTNTAFKAERRSDVRKTEISRTDAFLYLATEKKNEGTDGDTVLSRKTYLLTQSTRAIKAAKDVGLFQKHMVCHPNALIAILEETGKLSGEVVNVVNLFENPFLAYTAKQVWEIIEPVIQDAKYMKHSQIEKLRNDVDFQLDLKMTNKDGRIPLEKRNQRIKSEMGILTMEDIERMERVLKDTKEQLQVSRSRIDELEKDIKKKDKVIVSLKSTKASNNRSQRKTSGKRIKRKP